MRVSLQRQLCAREGVVLVRVPWPHSGSLRCSVQTSSPRRSRFLRSALALLRTHTHTPTNMHISGKKQSKGRLKCTLHHLNWDWKLLFTEASHTKGQARTHILFTVYVTHSCLDRKCVFIIIVLSACIRITHKKIMIMHPLNLADKI